MDKLAKNFPIGLRDFKKVREKNSLYIDKTSYIHRMIQLSGATIYWFLARPRRFGKSLFVSALKYAFLGHKELFEGLDLHSQGYDFEPYPVIHLSMDSVDTDTVKNLKTTIQDQLNDIAETTEGVSLAGTTPKRRLISLIKSLKAKYKKNVVVLIDEYDKPILDYLDNEVMVEKIRKILQDFYVTLKSVEEDLHFVFITGISKVAQTAVHSAFNNLSDLTLSSDYAAICGFTIEEFHAAFDPYLEETLEIMRSEGRILPNHTPEGLTQTIYWYYDGYSWNGRTKVLNPYSINSFFSSKIFDKFWFMTGPSTYLEKAMKIDPLAFLEPRLPEYGKSELITASLGAANPVPTLFQTGYLTVDKIFPFVPIMPSETESDFEDPGVGFKEDAYALKIPNVEVTYAYEMALLKILFPSLSKKKKEEIGETCSNIKSALLKKDTTMLENEFKLLLSSIPYSIHISKHNYYQSMLQLALRRLTFKVHSEVMSAEGRSDLEITLSADTKVIIELKYIPKPNADIKDDLNKVEPAEISSVMIDHVKYDADWINKKLDQAVQAALTQIEEKKYARQYLGRYKIIKVGLAIYHRAKVKVAFGPDQEKIG